MDVNYMTRLSESDFLLVNPDKPAVKLENEAAWSYRKLNEKANAYANKLRELGVEKGDRVGILLFNCLEYFGLYFGIAKLGAIAVRLNFRLKSQEFEYLFNDAGIKALCFHSSLENEVNNVRDQVSIERYLCLPHEGNSVPEWAEPFSILETGSKEAVASDRIHMDDPVMLMYTSGTTGKPKGAIWSHGNTLWFSSMQAMKWSITGEETAMTTGPLYHVGAMEDLALPVLMRGGTVVITKSGGFSIERVLSVMEEENITHIFLFPFMIFEMLHLKKLNSFNLSKLKYVLTGGDQLPSWAVEQFRKKLPHSGLIQVYGLTEGTPIAASLDPVDMEQKGHTVGKPLPLAEIKIINENNEACSKNEVGEILIKSPVVSSGYWNKKEATEATFVNGWCRTGDLGKFDEDGYLIIAGRKKDMIRSGGENIYSAEIEDVLIRNEKVKDVAIIGIPDPKYIETVCAVIVPKDGVIISEDEIMHYCNSHLAGFKKPRKIVFIDELPRTPSGKIQKFMLRKEYENLNKTKT